MSLSTYKRKQEILTGEQTMAVQKSDDNKNESHGEKVWNLNIVELDKKMLSLFYTQNFINYKNYNMLLNLYEFNNIE